MLDNPRIQPSWREASSMRVVDKKRLRDSDGRYDESPVTELFSDSRKRVCLGRFDSAQHERQIKSVVSGFEKFMIDNPNSSKNCNISDQRRAYSARAKPQPRPEKLFREFLHEVPRSSPVYVHDGTIFHPFPRLPTEIRLDIWELARPDPQIVRLKKKMRGAGVYSTTPIPGILQACKESRCFSFEKWYPLNKPGNTTVTFYFNPDIDILYKTCEGCFATISCSCWTLWPYDVRQVVKRAILRGNDQLFLNWPPFFPLQMVFPSIKEIIILSPECTYTHMSSIRLSTNSLAASSYTFNWQHGQSILQISRTGPRAINLDKVSCMELAVTPETSKLYGFLKTRFQRMDVEDLLSRDISSARAVGNRHQKDLRETHRTKRRPIRKTGPKTMKEAIEENRRERIKGVIRKQLECGPEFFSQLCSRAEEAAKYISRSIFYIGPNARLHGARIGGRPGVFTIGLLGLD